MPARLPYAQTGARARVLKQQKPVRDDGLIVPTAGGVEVDSRGGSTQRRSMLCRFLCSRRELLIDETLGHPD